MAGRPSQLSWIRYFASVLLLIFVVTGAFYFLYVNKRSDQQSVYLLRLLGTAGQSVGETIAGLRGNVEKAVKVTVEPGQDAQALRKKVKEKLDLIPYLDRDYYGENLDRIPYLNLVSRAEADRESRKDKLEGVSIEVSVREEQGEYVLSYSAREPSEDSHSVKKAPFRVNAKLADLLAPSLPDDVFSDGVFVARNDGMVLLQKGGGTVRLTQLPEEKSPPQGEGGTESDLRSTTGIRDVEIAGKKYKLFVQPFRLPLNVRWGVALPDTGSPPPEEGNWIVGGLVSSASFRADTMAVSPTLLVLILCILVVGLLCVPFLRIGFIGLREGLRAHDVVVLAVALMVGCSLVTFAIIHLLTYRAERAVRREQLEEAAQAISDKLCVELDSLECELVRLEGRLSEKMVGESAGDTVKVRANILRIDSVEYPHFEMAFGMDGDGWQKWKWSVERATTPVSSFPGREYFMRARDFDLEMRPSSDLGPCDEDSMFFNGRVIQSIRSKTTSEVFAILSRRLSRNDPTGSIVTAIEAELLTLIGPVMPPGYGFAVIDRSGMVQFHSDRDRNLREDFFEEVDWDEEVTGSVFSGVSRHANITYRAEPRSAFVMPLRGTRWTFVVFADKETLGHLDLETLVFSLSIYGLYLLVFLLSCIFVHYQCRRQRAPGEACPMWFWPDRNHGSQYKRMIGWAGLFIVLWCLGTVLSIPYMPVWCIIYPPIMIAVLYWYLGRRRPDTCLEDKAETSRRWHWPYVVLVVCLLFSIAVLPPLTFYNEVHTEEVIVFAKQHQLKVAESLRGRAKRHVERYRDVRLSKANRDRLRKSLFLCGLADSSGRVPTSVEGVENAPDVHLTRSHIREFFSEPESTSGRSRQGLIAFFSQLLILPTYDEISAVTRGLSDPGSAGKYNAAWSTKRDSGESHLLVTIQDFLPYPLLGNERPSTDRFRSGHLSIETSLDYLRPASPFGVFVFVMGAVVALLWIARTTMRIVFLTDMAHPRSVRGEELVDDPSIDRQLRIRLRISDLQKPEDARPIIIDSRDIETAESPEALLDDVKNSAKSEILLTRFDYGLGDAQSAAKKLRVLEGLAAMEDTRIVIESSIDPLYFLTSAAHDFWAQESKQQIPLERWAAVLQEFSKLRREATDGEFYKLRRKFQGTLEKIEGFGNLPPDVKASLVSEGWPNSRLEEYAKALASRGELRSYTAGDVVDQMRDLAAAHYRRIWSTCSTNEKVLMYRLAQEGFVNWRMQDTLRSLIKRRIVVAAPNFRLMNESFRRFVVGAERHEVFQRWEKAVGESLWSRVRLPMVLAGVALVAFFVATQREFFNQSLGMLAALTAGLPALIKIVGSLAGDRHPPSTGG